MATVKGDVHDIGKNIVGVVLQCNNYEVVDLGVMVPAAKILETARTEQADIIGLSGLITPSLDEMCHVAAEMERQGFESAADDRRRHHQPRAYGGENPPELQARPDGLCERCEPRGRRGADADVGQCPRRLCGRAARRIRPHRGGACARAGGQGAPAACGGARQRAQARLVGRYQPPEPKFIGTEVLNDYPVKELIDYIDWTPFFSTWELSGKFPAILDDAKFGDGRALVVRGCACHA